MGYRIISTATTEPPRPFEKWFVLRENKNWFAWGKRSDHAAHDHAPDWATEYPDIVYVGANSDEYRFARVLKTVAYIVVDENEYGEPVAEKWQIRQD